MEEIKETQCAPEALPGTADPSPLPTHTPGNSPSGPSAACFLSGSGHDLNFLLFITQFSRNKIPVSSRKQQEIQQVWLQNIFDRDSPSRLGKQKSTEATSRNLSSGKEDLISSTGNGKRGSQRMGPLT